MPTLTDRHTYFAGALLGPLGTVLFRFDPVTNQDLHAALVNRPLAGVDVELVDSTVTVDGTPYTIQPPELQDEASDGWWLRVLMDEFGWTRRQARVLLTLIRRAGREG